MLYTKRGEDIPSDNARRQANDKKLIGQTPLAPSSTGRDPMYFVKPKEMTEQEIGEVIRAFGAAARRAYESGADGIHIGGAGGYLVNEFLSPFFNRRNDRMGNPLSTRFVVLSRGPLNKWLCLKEET